MTARHHARRNCEIMWSHPLALEHKNAFVDSVRSTVAAEDYAEADLLLFRGSDSHDVAHGQQPRKLVVAENVEGHFKIRILDRTGLTLEEFDETTLKEQVHKFPA